MKTVVVLYYAKDRESVCTVPIKEGGLKKDYMNLFSELFAYVLKHAVKRLNPGF